MARTILYTILGVVVVFYITLLFLLNRIPHVAIKKFGWLSLYHVTIDLGPNQINVHKISLRLNIFKEKGSPFRFFHLDITDLKVLLDPPAPSVSESESNPAPSTPKHKEIGDLQFTVPKRLLGSFFIDKIANQFSIHVYKFSFQVKHTPQKYLGDYLRIENLFNKQGSNRLVISLFNGFLLLDTARDVSQEIKLFRNIELSVLCDTILSCKNEEPNKLYVLLTNFSINLSVGKLAIPIDEITLTHPSQNGNPNTKKASAHGETEQWEPEISKMKPKKEVILGRVLIMQKAIDHLNTVELKLEDFSATYRDVELKVANFSTNLSCKERVALTNSDFFNFLVFLVSTKVFHKKSRVLDLPSLTNSMDVDARRLLAAIKMIRENPGACSQAQSQNLDLKISNRCLITNPKFDIYYDHADLLDILFGAKKKKKAPAKSTAHKGKVLDRKLWLILHFFGEVTTKLTLVDMDVNIHIPPKGFTKFHRHSTLNNVITFHLSSFVHKSSSRNFKSSRSSAERCVAISQIFKFKNFKMNALENIMQINTVKLMTGYNVLEESANIRLYIKKVDIKSINDAIFHLIREIRNWSNNKYNENYEKLQNARRNTLAIPASQYSETSSLTSDSASSTSVISAEPSAASTTATSPEIAVFFNIFDKIPTKISSVKIHFSSIEADITCKDGLPSHKIKDHFGNEIDMADFARGISIKLLHSEVSVKVPKKSISSSIKSVECSTLSEYDAEYSGANDLGLYDYEKNDRDDYSDVASFDSNIFVNQFENDPMKANSKKVLQINKISVANQPQSEDPNKLYLRVIEIDGRITIFLIWCAVYASLLMKYFAPEVVKVCSAKEMENATGVVSKKLNLDVQVDSTALIIRLPNNVDVLLELDMLKIANALVSKTIRFNNTRGFVVHPSTKLWTKLLLIKRSVVNLEFDDNVSISIEPNGVGLSIPSQFLLYTVIDNGITFGKAIAQVVQNFKKVVQNDTQFDIIHPHAKDVAMVFPHVRVKTRAFFLTLENDAFENELSYIFELGKFMINERLKCIEEFEKQCDKLRLESIESKIELQDSHEIENRNLENRINGDVNDNTLPVLSEDEINEKIQIVEEEFNMGLSKQWIRRFRKFRRTKIQKRKAKVARNWNEDPISDRMTEKYEIMSNPIGVPLFAGIFMDLDLEFDRVSPDIYDNLDDFIFKKAKGQPKQKYSILIPLFISLKCSGMYAHLLDYPLPLVSFPENSENEGKHTVHLRGNVIINETLYKRPEELRHIFVPFSPIAFNSGIEDTFYSVHIPRTLTPVKFVVDIQLDLNTDKACMLTWCKSYGPALGAAMSGFDNFTKPQIDDSPLGSWDKIALLLHGDFNVRIANELCLHIKGSADPFETIGMAAGLVFSWKNNVHLKINGNSKLDEILVLESDDFLLAIPNYSFLERGSWGIRDDNLKVGGGTGVSIDFESSEAKKYQKKIMKLTSDSRVKWKLGLLFERNKDVNNKLLGPDQERTTDFKAHYDVEVTGPQYDYHPDSYIGYRLDYLHFAISVELKPSSSSSNSHNALCLTALTFSYFFHWWYMMTKHVSLPARNGKLFGRFGKDKSLVSMGTHLWTIKYQLILEPLTVSHFYMHPSDDNLVKNNKIAFTGLKGKFKSCIIDLHQRKETVRYVNEKLNINNEVLHLKMNKGEVIIEEADIRVVKSIFSDKLIRGYLASQMATNLSDSLVDGMLLTDSSLDFGPQLHHVNIFANDGWVDADDFVELEQRDLLSSNPKIQIIPFFYSPTFSYVREFSFQKGGKYPFGNERTHDCALGTTKPELTQRKLMEERIHDIELKMAANKTTLMRKGMNVQRARKINREQKVLQEKLDVVRSLHQEVQGEINRLVQADTKQLAPKVEPNSTTEKSHGGDEDGDEVAYHPDTDSLNSEKSASIVPTSKRLSITNFGLELSAFTSHKTDDEMLRTSFSNETISGYHNRFIIHNMRLQWHNKLRDIFVDYIQRVSDRKSEVHFLSKQALDLVERVIKELRVSIDVDSEEKSAEVDNTEDGIPLCRSRSENPEVNTCANSEEIILKFEEEITKIGMEQDVEKDYLFKLISPQIQLNSKKDRSSCVLISARDIEFRLLDINKQGMSDIISESVAVSGLIESRYGLLFRDAHVFVFKKDENELATGNAATDFYAGAISTTDKEKVWPPWIDFETCYENSWLQNELVVERNNMAIIYSKQNPLYAKSVAVADSSSKEISDISATKHMRAAADRMDIHLAKMVISATAEQYGSVNTAIIDLFLKAKTKRDETFEKLEKIMSLTDYSELEGLDLRVADLQKKIKFYRLIFLQLDLRGIKLTKECETQLGYVEMELERMKIELFVLLKGLRLKSLKSGAKVSNIMNVFANQVILHLLTEDREPFIDFALAKLKYVQKQSIDRTSTNLVEVQMLQAFNLQSNAVYPEMLRPLGDIDSANDPNPLIKLTWKTLEPVGGIGILEKALFAFQPIKIELDYDTISTLMSYVFPKPEEEVEEIYDSDSDEDIDSMFSNSAMDSDDSLVESDLHSSTIRRSRNPFSRFIKKRIASNGSFSDQDSISLAQSDSLSPISSYSSEKKMNERKKMRASIQKKKKSSKKKINTVDPHNDIAVIMDRASKYFSIVDLELVKAQLVISFKAPKALNIIDVHRLQINLPTLRYTNKVWSSEEAFNRFKKDVIKIVLAHTGKIIGNKFKSRDRKVVAEPLKQVSDYSTFMSLKDLQLEGRSRDTNKTGHSRLSMISKTSES